MKNQYIKLKKKIASNKKSIENNINPKKEYGATDLVYDIIFNKDCQQSTEDFTAFSEIKRDVKKLVRPQDAFISSSFFEVVSKHSNKSIKYNSLGIPSFKNRSLIYSSDKYKEIKHQYHIGYSASGFHKFYNIKFPELSISDLNSSYRQSFRRNLKKSYQQSIHADWVEADKIGSEMKKILFEIHLESTKRMKVFSLPWFFFKNLFTLEGIDVKLLHLKNSSNKIVSFQLMLGKTTYVSSIKNEAFSMNLSNRMLHEVYQYYQDDLIYLGSSFVGSGTDNFKKSSGVIQIPCLTSNDYYPYKVAHVLTNTALSKNSFLLRAIKSKVATKEGLISVLPYS